MTSTLDQFRHPAWGAIVGMGLSYLAMLVAITVVLFIVPYFIFLAF